MSAARSAPRVLSVITGIAAIFDLTGAMIFRVVRPRLPESPPAATRADPFQSAMDTIVAAHREVITQLRDKNGVSLPA
jgi:hypothetical protein